MQPVIDFIIDLKFSSFGLDVWDFWVFLVGVIGIYYLIAMKLANFLKPEASSRTKKWLKITFHALLYAVVVFILLHAVLTENYERLTLTVFLLILPELKRWTGKVYKKYDRFVDRVTD